MASSRSTAPEPQWPPRSPHEVLLSTPGGREKLRRIANRGSPSPSPSPSKLRASRTAGSLSSSGARRAAAVAELGDGMDGDDDEEDDDDDDDDDDEETLRLKLQAIQARLKLKKLQKAQRKTATVDASSDLENQPAPGPRARSAAGNVRRAAEASQKAQAQTQATAPVEVPASPVRRTQAVNENIQRSPSRVLLGIDKGLKAKDVSLKRAPSLRKTAGGQERTGSELGRPSRTPVRGQASSSQEEPRPLSFSERLASARTEEVTRREKQERIQKLRSTAFGVGKDEVEGYRAQAVEIPHAPDEAPAFSRDEILGVSSKPKTPRGGYLSVSKTAPALSTQAPPPSSEPGTPSHSHSLDENVNSEKAQLGASSFEPYSGLHLSNRILPHPVVARQIAGKKTYLVKDLLREVKSPDFSLPDVETDIVVFAIVAEKSEPQHHKPVADSEGKAKTRQPAADRGKFMAVTLADLEHELGLYLFDTGFTRFYKLPLGAVVAILNPTVMPPPRGREDTGKFSLVINSDADTILEVGRARDLSWCESVKRDGKKCGAWVNSKKTRHCEFHTNEALRRVRGSRNEVNMASFGVGRYKNSRGVYTYKKPSDSEKRFGRGLDKDGSGSGSGRGYDRESQSSYYMAGAAGLGQHQSAASLIDTNGAGSMVDKAEREEGLKRRIAAREKEQDIARKLGELGAGAGRDYMQSSASASSGGTLEQQAQQHQAGSAAEQQAQRALDAKAALGLLARPRGSDAAAIHLSPVKRKRSAAARTATTAASTNRSSSSSSAAAATLGWGGALSSKLARMKAGESLKPNASSSATSYPFATATAAAAGAGAGAGSGADAAAADRARSSSAASAASSAAGQPVRKKTRFVTEKGIREAGRESLGGDGVLSTTAAAEGVEKAPAAGGRRRRDRRIPPGEVVSLDDDDDEDELVIV